MKFEASPGLKKFLADKTFDLTNIGAGALLFGQFLSDKKFSLPIAMAGLALVAIGYVVTIRLYRGGEKKT